MDVRKALETLGYLARAGQVVGRVSETTATLLERLDPGTAQLAAAIIRAPNAGRSGGPTPSYQDAHWGHDGWRRAPARSEVPRPGPGGRITELGALTRIAYLARKGDEDDDPDELVEFFHDFDRPYPSLCFSPSGLLIARGESKYHVTAHGIER